MALRSVLDIDVNSAAFDAFVQKFQAFQQAAGRGINVAVIPGGAGSGGGAGPGGGGGGAIVPSGGRGPGGRIGQPPPPIITPQSVGFAQRMLNTIRQIGSHTYSMVGNTGRLSKMWSSMREASGGMLRNIEQMASRFLHVGGAMAALTGLATGFGFLGMAGLGRSATSMRTEAWRAGTTVGSMQSFAVNMRRFADPSMIGQVANAQQDITKAAVFASLGMRQDANADPADTAIEMMRRIRAQAPKDPRLWAQFIQSHQLGQVGIGLEQLRQMTAATPEEFEAQTRQYRRDRPTMDLPPEIQRRWNNFTTQMDRASKQIQITFIKGLAPLATPLEHLSQAFTRLIEKVLKQIVEGGWVDKLAKWIDDFGKYLTSQQFQDDVRNFGNKLSEIVKALGGFVDWVYNHLPGVKRETGPGTEYGVTPEQREWEKTHPRTQKDPAGHPVPGTEGGHGWGGGSQNWPLWMNPGGTVIDPETGLHYHKDKYGNWQVELPWKTGPAAPPWPGPKSGFSEEYWKQTHPGPQASLGAGAFLASRFAGGGGPGTAFGAGVRTASLTWTPIPETSFSNDNINRATGATTFSQLEQAQGLPSGILDAVWKQESGRGRSMVSSAGALGHFQFMPGTWASITKQMGMQGASPFDLAASSKAAAFYLHQLMQEFGGDPAKALAAYNWGPGNIERVVRQFGAEWQKHLPRETTDYLARTLPAGGGGKDMPAPGERPPGPHTVAVRVYNETGGNAITAGHLAA